MGKSTYNNFISSYETVRKILRDMYVFGCYDNLLYEKKLGIKLKTYEKELQRKRFYIAEKYQSDYRKGRFKVPCFAYDRFDGMPNYLANSYKLKTFTAKQLSLYFSVLPLLGKKGNGGYPKYSIRELSELLSAPEYGADFSDKDISEFMNRMTEAGLIVRMEGKPLRYSLPDNVLDVLTSEEIYHLYYAVDFCCNTMPYSIPGYYLKDTLRAYLKWNRGTDTGMIMKRDETAGAVFDDAEEKAVSIYEYNFMQHVLNDEMIQRIAGAIKNRKKLVIITYKEAFSDKTEDRKPRQEKKGRKIIPLKFFMDYRQGWQYLICKDEEDGTAETVRLDRIKQIRVLKESFQEEDLSGLEERWESAWNVSLFGKREKSYEVLIDFYYDAESEYIRKRLEAEKRTGTIETIASGHCLYRAWVSDPMELIPWIRSYGNHAVVREGKDGIRKKLYDDWEAALRNYGVIS